MHAFKICLISVLHIATQSSTIPVINIFLKVEGIIKINYRLTLELTITKRSDIHTKQPSCKKGAALKSLGEESCEIKGGSQQMAAMMLILTMYTAIIKTY